MITLSHAILNILVCILQRHKITRLFALHPKKISLGIVHLYSYTTTKLSINPFAINMF